MLLKIPNYEHQLGDGRTEATPQSHEDRISRLRMLNSERKLEVLTMTLSYDHRRGYRAQLTRPRTHVSCDCVSAWSTPWFWETFGTGEVDSSIDSIIQRLELLLRGVQGLAFRFSLDFSRSKPLSEKSTKSLLQLLANEENSWKISSLTLYSPPQAFLDCLSKRKLPFLEDLSISTRHTGSTRRPHPQYSIIDLPHLCSLSLDRMNPTRVELSWSSVTTLYLHNTSIDICISIFLQCRNVDAAQFRYPTNPPTPASVPQWLESTTDMIEFPHLRVLFWPYHPDRTSVLTFPRIYSPSLSNFVYYGGKSHLQPESLLSIIAKFPSLSMVTNLELHELDHNDRPAIREIFTQTKDLEGLQLEDCHNDIVQDAISILDPATDPENGPNNYLPFLGGITVEGKDITIGQDLQWSIFRFSERQRDSGQVPHLFLHLDVDMCWDSNAQRAIESLDTRKFEMDLREDFSEYHDDILHAALLASGDVESQSESGDEEMQDASND